MSNFNNSSNGGSGLGRALRVLGILQIVVIVVGTITFLAFPKIHVLSVVVLVFGTIFVLSGLVDLISTKRKAMRGDGEPVSFWKGLAEMVAWNPTKRVLFLKNKNIHFVDSNPNDGGGIRVMFPHFGEELVLRVPLEIQTLSFEDKEVLTKEYMPLTIRGTMYWKVVDLSKFYLLVSKEVHFADDRSAHGIKRSANNPQLEVAEYWLRSMSEEKTRTVISQIGTGLFIADKLTADLPAVLHNNGETLFGGASQTVTANRSATEGLASAIKTEFAAGVSEYGLEIHRVALQEVKLDPQIYAAAVEACKSAYLPIKAKAEAIARSLKLQADADVIGKEATGMKEIVKNMPAPAFASNISALAIQETLGPFFMDLNNKRAASISSSQTPPPIVSREVPPVLLK